MNRLVTLAAAALLATPTWASHFDGNPDLERSILNSHASHVPHAAGDSHQAEREWGAGLEYGSIVNDVALESHVPHGTADSHRPEKEPTSATYGTVLEDVK